MIILHGENIVLSRQKLKEKTLDFKKKTKGEVLFFNGSAELIDIQQAFQSLSLLGEHQLVIIENLFSGRKSKEKEKTIAFIKDLQPKNLIIWEGKKIDGRLLSSFQGQVLKFDLIPVLFHFLDSLRPGNVKASLIFLHQTLEQLPPEMIFFMLVKHFRLLILATDLEGVIVDFYYQKISSPEAKIFRDKKFTKQFKGLSILDFDNNINQIIGESIIEDGRIYMGTTKYGDKVAFRPSIVNWRTLHEDVKLIIDIVREIGKTLT